MKPRGDLRDLLDLDEAISLERTAGADQIHDAAAQAQRRRKLHRAVQLDAFRLHAPRGKMPPGDIGIFGRDTDMAPLPRIVLEAQLFRLGDRQPAFADTEIQRRVNLGIFEFHQNVVAGNAEMGRAEGDEGGDIEAAYPDNPHRIMIGGEVQLARFGIEKGRLRRNAGLLHQRHGLIQNAALRHRQDQRFVFSNHRLSLSPDDAVMPGFRLFFDNTLRQQWLRRKRAFRAWAAPPQDRALRCPADDSRYIRRQAEPGRHSRRSARASRPPLPFPRSRW